VLSASAVVAYVAVGAAAILGRSVTEAARDALAWVLARDDRTQAVEGVARARLSAAGRHGARRAAWRSRQRVGLRRQGRYRADDATALASR